MKNTVMGLLIVLALTVAAGGAAAQQLFDFNGQATLPAGVGGALTMHGIVFDAPPTTTPIPLDFAGYQFTLVVTGLILDVDGNPQIYSGGTVVLYQDAATAADYTNLGTFTDGTPILVGTITTLNKIRFTPTLGSVMGTVDWTGGTRLDDIAPWDQDDWTFLSGTNAGATQVLPGFAEAWDGKVEPKEPIVEAETSSWGSVKALFGR